MPHINLIISTVISLVIAWFVMFKPLFYDKQQLYFVEDTEGVEFDESISVLETLDELEVDFETGKISKEEFDQLALEYQRNYLDMKNNSSNK